MKSNVVRTLSGEEIIFLEPESEEDVRELQRRVQSGEVGDKNSFGDWKKPKDEESEVKKGWSAEARRVGTGEGPYPVTHDGLQSFAKDAGITVERQHKQGGKGGSAAVHHKDFGMGELIYSSKGVHASFAMRKRFEVDVAKGFGTTFEDAWKRATGSYRELHAKGWRNAWTK